MLVTIPPVTPGDAVRLSASTYVAWKKCPDSANARLQGLYGPDSRPAFLGSLAHRIFARHLTAGPISSEEFVQACKEEIGASGLNNKLGSVGLKPSTLAGVIEEVRSLYERFIKLPGEGFEGSEVVLDFQNDDGVQLVGTAARKAGILSFVVDGIHPHDLGTILDTEGVAIRAGHHCAMPVMTRFGIPGTARASFALYNGERDVAALVAAIDKAQEMFGTRGER